MSMLQISKKKDVASFKHLYVCNIYIIVPLSGQTEYILSYGSNALASTCL